MLAKILEYMRNTAKLPLMTIAMRSSGFLMTVQVQRRIERRVKALRGLVDISAYIGCKGGRGEGSVSHVVR